MIDTATGKVEYAVLSFGGILGIGDKLFAVPFDQLLVDHANHRLVLDADKKRLEAAPGFDKDNWPDFAAGTFRSTVDQFYRHRAV